MSTKPGQGQFPWQQPYALERTAEGSYQARIPMSIQPSEAKAEVLSRANECFRKVSPFLKGPGGTQLEIQLAESTDLGISSGHFVYAFDPVACKAFQRAFPGEGTQECYTAEARSKLADLSLDLNACTSMIGKNCYRQDSRWWSREQSCAVTVHEVLHLMGLDDHYAETSLAYSLDERGEPKLEEQAWLIGKEELKVRAYNCRVVGPASSVMSDQYAAFLSVGLDRNGDPLGKRELRVAKRLSGARRDIRQHRKTAPGSLLLPGELEMLLYPGCASTGKDYADCTSFAYVTDLSGLGVEGPGCGPPELRERCRDLRWLTEWQAP